MSTIVRDAVVADASGVAAVFEPYVRDSVVTFETEPLPVEVWEMRLAAGPFVVLTVDDEIKGYAYASPWRPKPAYRHTVETTVYLSADATGRGHGRRLMTELLKRCNGYRQAIAVVVASQDESSLRLHKSLGYEEVGRLRKVGWKQGQWWDTLLLQREL